MNVNNVVRTITVRGSSEGVEKLTGDLNKLAGAQQNVAVVSEQSARRVLSLEDAWKKQSLKLDESARSQANIARETKIADGALREGLVTQQQHAERLNLISQRYAVATVQAGKFAAQTGLNRYEILNLSRQMQDVGVSLAGGQSPFVVLTQQGSQILDVFQATNGSVRGFFGQAIGWAGRFVASTAGVVTGVTGIGAAALYAATSWSSGQREIDKALIGIGARSGATADSINKIAEASAGSTSKLSISESRTAALEFVKTGSIYTENIGALVGLVKGHAVAIGESSEEASKQLAKIFGGDIAEGADKLNSIYGTISGATRQYAVELDILGKRQEAIALLAKSVAPAIQRASEVTGFWARSWDAVGNVSSNTFDRIGKGLAGITGVGLTRTDQRDSLQKQLSLAESDLSQRQNSGVILPGFDTSKAVGNIERLRDAVAKLNKEIAGAGAETDQSRLLKIGQDADAAVRSLVPFIDQMEKVAKAQELIKRAQGSPGAQQGLGGFNAEAARAGEVLALNIKNTREETDRANASALQLAQKYNTGSIEVAKMAEHLSRQLSVAQAVGHMAQIEAQHRARIAELSERMSGADAKRLADGERLVELAQIEAQHKQTMVALQGQLSVAQQSTGVGQINAQYEATVALLTLQIGQVKAIEQAEAQRAISIAQVNANAEKLLTNLRQEGELIRASSDAERDRIAARQTYQDLVDRGVDSTKAAAVASQQLANAEDRRHKAEQKAHDEAIRNIKTRTDAWDAYKRGVISWSEANNEAGNILRRQEAAADDAAHAMNRFTSSMFEATQAALLANAAFVPFATTWASMGPTSLGTGGAFQGKQGLSQFNPEGYKSSSGVGGGTGGTRGGVSGGGGLTSSSGFESDGQATTTTREAYIGGAPISLTQPSSAAGGDFFAEVSKQMSGGIPALETAWNSTFDKIQKKESVPAVERHIAAISEQMQPSPFKDELLKSLNEQLKLLKGAVDENTDALKASIDPIFSQGHDYLNSLRIGYYKAATGLSGIVQGSGGVDSTPVHMMLTPGEHVQVTPPGHRPSNVSNDNSRAITQNITQNIQIAEAGPVNRLTARQMSQGFIAAAARAVA